MFPRSIKFTNFGNKEETKRLQLIHQNLLLPKPILKVQLSIVFRILLKMGLDINICPICKKGMMILENTKIYFNGILIDINIIKNKGSPKKDNLCYGNILLKIQ
ncbi:MAG: hypothetical protein IPG12_13525 [Saprospiraceae bacterium]|nr:hypothetical protein [Saprospiraceae bacterium]